MSSRDGVVQDLGWGRLVFGQTFDDPEALGAVLRAEATGRRDICLYLAAPHVFVSQHPQEYFIDPSFTYRVGLEGWAPPQRAVSGVTVRAPESVEECAEMNRVYVRNHMVPADVALMWHNEQNAPHVLYLVAVDDISGEVLGTVTGVDHLALFDDPERGSSLWCLAVDPACTVPGVGELLVRTLLELLRSRGCAYVDLSVIHDNTPAIRLYEKLGFEQVPVLGVKRKNAINEHLFTAAPDDIEHLNPYARIIADEAIRRGILVTVLDAEGGYLRLEHGGRTVTTRESLSELTSAIAMSRCDDKRVTRKVVSAAGVAVAAGRTVGFDEGDHAFLDQVGAVVVKPASGEQGQGITVNVTSHQELDAALARAGGPGTSILLEQQCVGDDLRIVVIDGQVVAAAIRRPAEVVGNGTRTVRELITAQSRRRQAATGGESSIPLDELTEATVREEGWELDDVLPQGERLRVRRTANLHTGGTIHDVTDELHPTLARAAITAAAALEIPVTGIDLMVPRVDGEEYVFIEANERPGLANHEPRPTARAYVDFLFPRSRATEWAWQPTPPGHEQPDTTGPGDAVGPQ